MGEIINSFAEEVFSPGDFIIREDQDGREMYFVLKGHCDVLINTVHSPSGKGEDEDSVPDLQSKTNSFSRFKQAPPKKLVVVAHETRINTPATFGILILGSRYVCRVFFLS